jgi:vitamin B12 transporter
LSGTVKRFGYYLTAGNLRSDGFRHNTANNMNSLYGKVSAQLPGEGKLTVGLSYLTAAPGQGQEYFAGWGITTHDNNQYRRTNGFLTLLQPLSSNLNLDINANFSSRDEHAKWGELDSNGTSCPKG